MNKVSCTAQAGPEFTMLQMKMEDNSWFPPPGAGSATTPGF